MHVVGGPCFACLNLAVRAQAEIMTAERRRSCKQPLRTRGEDVMANAKAAVPTAQSPWFSSGPSSRWRRWPSRPFRSRRQISHPSKVQLSAPQGSFVPRWTMSSRFRSRRCAATAQAARRCPCSGRASPTLVRTRPSARPPWRRAQSLVPPRSPSWRTLVATWCVIGLASAAPTRHWRTAPACSWSRVWSVEAASRHGTTNAPSA
mmetsp:Transcript_1918/g.4318  ORF Transcript_1918/g.4318 Transcript_1918/m.4318 type:complete len:205 (-) Transcript_1918:430-1044(-)